MSGRNIVPMPQGMPRPGATQAAPQGQMMPMPAPMMWSGSGFPAGCCPPGGMDALLQCYCDVQAATAFISKVVQDLAANDPAFQQSLVDAIVASGSNIPLIGVTNGADAQPGQVGEWVAFAENVSYPAAANTATVTMGVLQPGDWDTWAWAYVPNPVSSLNAALNPLPAGFTAALQTFLYAGTAYEQAVLNTPAVRALTTVPSLINFTVITNAAGAGPAAGTLTLWFSARRRR